MAIYLVNPKTQVGSVWFENTTVGNSAHLVRPGNVGLGLSEHEEREHGHPVEYPDREAKEVDEALDVAAKDHHLGDKSLANPY